MWGPWQGGTVAGRDKLRRLEKGLALPMMQLTFGLEPSVSWVAFSILKPPRTNGQVSTI